MTNTTSKSPLHSQAEASVDAVATEIQREARQELNALRSLISTGLVALERALDRDEDDPAFDPIIQKLCEVAAEQAEAASTWARAQAEETTARELATAREQAHADLDAARGQSEAAQAQSEVMRLDLEQRLAQAVAATAETADALATLRAQSDAAQLEFEQRLAQSERATVEAALALADAERVAASARDDAEIGAATLDDARTRISALEQERAELVLVRDIAEAHLAGEVHTRTAIAAELDAAREMTRYAQTDADGGRLAMQRATDRIRVLEERHRKLDAEPPRRSPSVTFGEAGAMLDQVRAALQTLTGTTTGRGLLDALLELLAQLFSSVAWCVVTPQDCVVWGSRGFDPPLQSRKTVIPLPTDSPLARALAAWKPAMVQASDSQGPSGLSGRPISYAIALPILAQDHGAVMLYAENPPESACGDPDVAAKIADILADHVRRRLRNKQTASSAEPPPHSPARQARRVKIQEDTNVAVDGAPSTLVDLSTLGAQVLSPRAVRPNHFVRLVLPNDKGGLSCRARVVWVQIEQSQDHTNALYRAGIQFRGVDAPELEAFFTQHGIFEPAIRH